MKSTRWFLAVICAGLSLVLFFKGREVSHRAAPSSERNLAAAPKVPAIVRSLRPNYPYSVIPGGIYSAAELRSRVERDPLVRSHYAGFDTRAARLVVTGFDRYQYASYRMNGQIYWTSRKLRIPKGEILMTDGVNLARTRCGNRLSELSMPGVARLEPELKDLSLPSFSMDLLRDGPLTLAEPPLSELSQLPQQPFLLTPAAAASEHSPQLAPPILLPVVMPVPGVLGGSQSSPPSSAGPTPSAPTQPPRTPATQGEPIPGVPDGPPHVTEIPEPGALTLFAIFLFASAWALSRMRRLSPAKRRRGCPS